MVVWVPLVKGVTDWSKDEGLGLRDKVGVVASGAAAAIAATINGRMAQSAWFWRRGLGLIMVAVVGLGWWIQIVSGRGRRRTIIVLVDCETDLA